ncbi:MAG: glycosyltransferase family 4 protein [Nitriliruptoraceae bacterium]
MTNDLEPRTGGIQQFVGNLLRRVHPETTVVIGPAGGPEATLLDAARRHRTVRAPGAVLPTPAVRRLVVDVARTHRPDVIVLGAAWPLGELARPLRAALGVPVVALSHGLEAGMAGAGLGHLIHRATRDLAAVTTISRFTFERLRPHLAAERIRMLPPGVDIDLFHPGVDGSALRQRLGVPPDAVAVGCVSRLVPRKGQDRLLDVWPIVRARHPDAWLVLVGEGPLEDRLQRRVRDLGADGRVVLSGRLAWEELPAAHAALDLFAMPCRTRWGGLDVEGLGIVYLEAQASGVPVIAGRSGGAPEAVAGPETGTVVDARGAGALLGALDEWLADPVRRRAASVPARRFAVTRYGWDAIASDLRALLDEVAAG